MVMTNNHKKMSSDGVKPSAGFLTMNHNAFRLAGQQWQPVTAHLLLVPSYPAPSYSVRGFLWLPQPMKAAFLVIQTLSVCSKQTVQGNPLYPTLTGNSEACHLLFFQSWTKSWSLVAFLSLASAHPSSHRMVSSNRKIFLAFSDQITTSSTQGSLHDLGKAQFLAQIQPHLPWRCWRQ